MTQKEIKGFAFFLLIQLFLTLSGNNVYSQLLEDFSVDINANRKPLHIILDDISDQIGYDFTFDSRLVDSRKEISLRLEGISLREAIDTLFGLHQLSYSFINQNIVLFRELKTQSPSSIANNPDSVGLLIVNGTIKDARSDKALPFANIALMNSTIGTISNENGAFTLRIPDTLNHVILAASYIGYKNQYTPISIRSEEELEILMFKNVISLQEVIIRYQDPYNLLSEALRKIKENYSDVQLGMYAYYREKVAKDDKCMIFSEAVAEIAKASYSKSLQEDRTRLLKGRTISNISIQDTIILKLRSGINSLLELDVIKRRADFLAPDFMFRYNLHFSNLVMYKDRLVYVLSFRQKDEIQNLLFRGEIYIDKETLSIVALDFNYDPARIRSEQDLFVIKKSSRIKVIPLSAEYRVEFSETDGKYHLGMVQGNVRFKIRRKRQWISSKYNISLEMAVTDVRKEDVPEIKLSEQIKPSTVLSEETFEYDPDFWGPYNTIAPETSLTEALKRIEKSMVDITELKHSE